MVAVVTGASDGIGRAVAAMLSEAGGKVYGISRTPGSFEFMEHVQADVSDRDSIESALDMIYEREGNVDALVCCAGTSLASPADMTDPEDSHYLFGVNYWGCVDAASFAMSRMKNAGKGRIVVVSSVTGILPLPYLSFYSSSKAALISFACSADAEAKSFGVRVCAVMPGGVRTELTDKRKKYWDKVNDPMAPGLDRAIKILSREEETGMPPEQVARKIIKLIKSKNPPALTITGGIYKVYGVMQRLLPSRAILHMLRRKYSV